MKVIRFLNSDQKIQYGIVKSNNIIDLISDDILSAYHLTGQTCSMGDIIRYLPPVDPPNIFALGLNYKSHAAEFNDDLPDRPLIFIKATTSLTAHRCPVILPREAPCEVDYEAELAVVIGKAAKNITSDQVDDYILGYTCANDVSARDCQKRIDKQWARAKSFDTFCPLGPVLETNLDPSNLRIRSVLNGQTMQGASTADLIFSVPEIVSYLSRNFTLLPGTVILTGTPEGVGFAREKPVFLQPGDRIAVEIEKIGRLENQVITE